MKYKQEHEEKHKIDWDNIVIDETDRDMETGMVVLIFRDGKDKRSLQ